MRILVISNLYPPYYLGGYELRCQAVVEKLREWGHTVWVITSRYKVEEEFIDSQEESHVFRVLQFQWEAVFAGRNLHQLYRTQPYQFYQQELQDNKYLRRLVRQFHPDMFYVWNGGGISKSLLIHAQSYRIPTVYQFDDDWFLLESQHDFWLNYCDELIHKHQRHPLHILWTAWLSSRQRFNSKKRQESSPSYSSCPPAANHDNVPSENISSASNLQTFLKKIGTAAFALIPPRLFLRLIKRPIARYLPLCMEPINLKYACFASHFRKKRYLDAGVSVESAEVIPGGIDIARFSQTSRHKTTEQFKILCAAQLYEGKGIHTVIDALELLLHKGYRNITLTICGREAAEHAQYTERLHQQVKQSPLLRDVVQFLGKIPYEQMPVLYQQHDLFISASIIVEEHPLTMIEAMSSGTVVLSSGTGGGREIIHHNENGLLFPPGDHVALAEGIETLIKNPELSKRFIENGLKSAPQYDIEYVTKRIEQHLRTVLLGHKHAKKGE